MNEVKNKKKEKITMPCGLCIEEGRSKAAVFNGTRAQIANHVKIAHKGKMFGGK